MDFYTVDSGKQGAIVEFRDSEPESVYEIPYDETGNFIDFESLTAMDELPTFMEKITPFAPNSKTIAVQFQAYGALVSGLTYTSCGQLELIPVPTWQGFMRKKRDYPPRSKWTKDDSRFIAESLWPDFAEKFKKRKLPDGIADAMCIGAYVLGR
jgi:hypothetical protein